MSSNILLEYRTEKQHRVKRIACRASYVPEVIHAILDAGYLCHISFVDDGLTLPLKTASLAEWSNPGKENGSDEVNEGAVHAGVQARGGAHGQERAELGGGVEGARHQRPDAAQLGQA